MNNKEKLYNTLISCYADLNVSNVCNVDLKQLGYTPDGFIVRSIQAHSKNSNDEFALNVNCNLINDTIGGIITANNSSTVNNSTIDFKLQTLNTNNLTLTFNKSDGTALSLTNSVFVIVLLEFYKI